MSFGSLYDVEPTLTPAPRDSPASQGAVPSAAQPRFWTSHPWLVTLAAWLVCLPAALILPGLVGLSPLTLRGSAVPLLVGVVMLASGLLAAWRWPGEIVACLAAGLLAGWVVLTMRTALYGTPYGFGGLSGDIGRLTAMANRYSTTMRSSDGIVGTVPSDYPMLFPWLIGRAAALSGTPAWRLIGISQTLLMSGAVVLPFLLWRRILPGGLALAVTVTCFGLGLALGPAKPYEGLALGLILPWTLATFAEVPRGRLHWLGAGVIGGLQVVLYQADVMFVALGIVAIVVVRLRGPGRGAYARHVAAVIAVASLISAWYLVPYLGWDLTHGLQMTDRFQDPTIGGDPFPFLSASPIGLLTAIGVLGLVWYRRVVWWGLPLIALAGGEYAYRFIAEVGFVANGDTGVFQYTAHTITVTFAVAGVLSIIQAAPGVRRRLAVPRPPRGLDVVVVSALVAVVGVGAWIAWLPGSPPGPDDAYALTGQDNEASQAFLQPLPDGRYVRFAPSSGRLPWFPLDPIIRDVAAVRGVGDAPATLSDDEEIYGLRAWPGYLGVGANAAASTSHWFSRLSALETLSRVRSPGAFSRASQRTPFGPIDVFILSREGGSWTWTPTNYPARVSFRPEQFSPRSFAVFSNLPDDTVLVVRRIRASGSRRR